VPTLPKSFLTEEQHLEIERKAPCAVLPGVCLSAPYSRWLLTAIDPEGIPELQSIGYRLELGECTIRSI